MKTLLLVLCFFPFAVTAQVTNDDPCNAIPLQMMQGPGFCQQVNFNMSNATYNAAYTNTPCTPGASPAADVWFKFAVPASGSCKVYTSMLAGSPDNDGMMYLYTATNCSAALTYITCDDDGGFGNGNDLMPLKELTGLTPGDSIFVRFMQYNGATNGLFNICVTEPQIPLATQKVGIGLNAPDSTLDVNGNMVVRGGVRINNTFQVTGNTQLNGNAVVSGNTVLAGNLLYTSTSPGSGKVLTSDATGNASWQAPVSNVGNGTSNQTLRNNGSSWVSTGSLTNDGSTVTIAGNLRISSGSPGAGKLLSSDASGNAAWQLPTNYNSGFAGYLISNQSIPTATLVKILWLENYDDPAAYTPATGEFTAPGAGLYRFDVQVQWQGGNSFTGNQPFYIDIYKNGIQASFSYDILAATALPFTQRTGYTLKLASGDKVDIRVRQSSGVTQAVTFSASFFTGYRIY
ncbi:MAG: hypothetical protein QM687_07115 [Ferruginibacter sp.]